MAEAVDDRYPVLRARPSAAAAREVDGARQLLWRAFQRGELSEEEFARTVERLEPPPNPAPSV